MSSTTTTSSSLAAASSSSSANSELTKMQWEAHPIGQDAQGSVGACASACTYVARLLCALPRHVDTPDPALISNMVIAACMHWKTYVKPKNESERKTHAETEGENGWQSITTALKNNFVLRMAIVGNDRCLTPHAAHKATNTHLNVLDELRHPNFLDAEGKFQGEHFAQPVCALFCDGTYTYLVCKRFLKTGRLEYLFFDPHGVSSLVKGFEDVEDCVEFLRDHCDLHSGTRKTWDWNWILCTLLPPSRYQELEKEHEKETNTTTKARKKRK